MKQKSNHKIDINLIYINIFKIYWQFKTKIDMINEFLKTE